MLLELETVQEALFLPKVFLREPAVYGSRLNNIISWKGKEMKRFFKCFINCVLDRERDAADDDYFFDTAFAICVMALVALLFVLFLVLAFSLPLWFVTNVMGH